MHKTLVPPRFQENMQERRWLAFILGLYAALAFVYSWLIPPWEGPDEPAHYILAVNLARTNKFSSIERNYEAGQPQTYYRLAAIPLRWLYLLEPEWVAVIQPEADFDNVRNPTPIYTWSRENYQFMPGLYLLRWLNILLGTCALFLFYRGMRNFVMQGETFPTIPLTTLALLTLIPQFLHTTSTVSNDTLGILAGAFLFWTLSKLVLGEVGLWGMGLMLVAAILFPYGTKLTVLPVGVSVVIAVVITARERWPARWRWMAGSGVALGLGVMVVVSLFLPEMGELFLRQISLRMFGIVEGSLAPTYLWEMIVQVVWSFWGKVGWLAVGLPGWVVVLLTSGALAGIGAEGIKRQTEEKWKLSWVIWLVAGLAIVAVLKNGLSSMNSQGRFLFPAAGALGVLMVSGWGRLLPARARPFLPVGVFGLMLGVNLILWFWGMIPVYYQPFLTE